MNHEIRLLTPPWEKRFVRFVRSIKKRAVLVAPFITEEPLFRLAERLNLSSVPRIEIITAITPKSTLQRAIDLSAIASLCRQFPTVTVRSVRELHAKVYIADDHTAIVTSGNLTAGSLQSNLEYGIEINSLPAVRRIAADMRKFSAMGFAVSPAELDKFAADADGLRQAYDRLLNTGSDAEHDYHIRFEALQQSLQNLHAQPSETTVAIFKRTIAHLLKKRPLRTREIHSFIQALHPDLCDDKEHLVIKGARFGRKWKHDVRIAQQLLKRAGIIQRDGDHWRLDD